MQTDTFPFLHFRQAHHTSCQTVTVACDLSEDYLYMLRNAVGSHELGPLVYILIIEAVWSKKKDETIGEYIQTNNLLEACGMKESVRNKWLSDNSEKLKEKDVRSFDITFLSVLLPIICHPQICRQGVEEWKTRVNDPTKIEHFLNLIKEFRNDNAHERKKAVQNARLSKLQSDMLKCLELAAQLYGLGQSVEDEWIGRVNDGFSKLIEDTSSTPERRAKFVSDCLIKYGHEEMENMARRTITYGNVHNKMTLLIDDIFYVLEFSCAVEKIGNTQLGQHGEKESAASTERFTFKCYEVFENDKKAIIIISGEAGSGKTTVFRKIFGDIVRAKGGHCVSSFTGIDRFRLALYIECRSEISCNLTEFMGNNFPKWVLPYQSSEVLMALNSIDGLLFLIDGYDEADDVRRNLVQEVIQLCNRSRGRALCIISSRVEAANLLAEKLSDDSVGYDHFSFEKITSPKDRIIFLEKYSAGLKEKTASHNANNSTDIVTTFRNLASTAQKVFVTPIMLALFCQLCHEDERNGVADITTAHDVYELLYTNCFNKITKMIRDNKWSKVVRPSFLAEKIMNKLCLYSVQLWRLNKYVFDMSNVDKFVQEFSESNWCSESIDFDRILSCILSPEQSVKGTTTSLAFAHLSIQEHLCSKQITKDLLSAECPTSQTDTSTDSSWSFTAIERCIGLEVRT